MLCSRLLRQSWLRTAGPNPTHQVHIHFFWIWVWMTRMLRLQPRSMEFWVTPHALPCLLCPASYSTPSSCCTHIHELSVFEPFEVAVGPHRPC